MLIFGNAVLAEMGFEQDLSTARDGS